MMTFIKLFISITNYFLINLDIPHSFTEPCPLSYDMPYFGCPYHAHGFWVGMSAMLFFMGGHGRARVGTGAILLFMGGHGWASILCISASNSKLESNFSDAGNTQNKKRSRLKLTTMNDLLFVRSNQDLV
jgi:hypothetical protein